MKTTFVGQTQSPRRREMLRRLGGGFGALALGSVFADAGFAAPLASSAPVYDLNPSSPISRRGDGYFLFMNGGPSQMDTSTRNAIGQICRGYSRCEA